MKKKLLVIMLALAFVFAAASCDNTLTNKALVGKQDTSYVVTSNGGSVVQYGNYIYFINGYRGYTDASGNENEWGKVEKGALYRAELRASDELVNGVTASRTTTPTTFYYDVQTKVPLNTFTPANDPDKGFEFISTETELFDSYELDEDGDYLLDDDGNEVKRTYTEYRPTVQRVASKTIGTAGYAEGGIYIFDSYIFYASPNNKKNKEGVVQDKKTDFYVTSIDGTTTKLIYTTKSAAAENAASPYAFYKYANNYYLVVLDGTNLVSVRISSTGKVSDSKKIAEDVISVHLPRKEIYYNFVSGGVRYQSYEFGVEDFIYYVRPSTNSEPAGNIIEMMRPNGSERIIIYNNNAAFEILGTDNGLFFYQTPNDVFGKTINYTNLHSVLSLNSPSYKKALEEGKIKVQDINSDIKVNVDAYNSIKCFVANPQSANTIYVAAFSDSKIDIFTNEGMQEPYRTVFNGSASFVKFQDNYLYFLSDDSLMRINIFADELVGQIIVDDATTGVTFRFDFTGNYVFYVGEIDAGYATDYLKYKSLNEFDTEGRFIGFMLADDYRSEEIEE